jgi:SAM-dependent methyltransferase
MANAQFECATINDFSPSMMRYCRDAIGDIMPPDKIRWCTENVFNLVDHLGSNKFDVVLCLGLIAHTGRLPALLRDIVSLLKIGGTVLLQSSLSDNVGVRFVRLIERTPLRRFNYELESFSLDKILSEANSVGLRVVDVRRFGVCFPFGNRLLGPLNYWIEKNFALRCQRWGGEVLIKFRKFT